MKYRNHILIFLCTFLFTFKGYGQSDFKWPETPSSLVFQDFITSYNSASQVAIETFIKTHYDEVDSAILAEKTEYWMDIYNRFGAAKAHSLSINKPNDLEVWLQGVISKTWFAPEFILNEESKKIKAVGMLLGMQPLNTSTPASSYKEFLGRVEAYLESNEQAGLFQGTVLMVQNGQIILNKGYGLKNIDRNERNVPNTRMNIASITKPITAIAILQLVQKGLLKLHIPINEYLAELPQNISQNITIYQLLTHTSGYKLKGIDGFKQEIENTISLDEVYKVHLKYLPVWEAFKDFNPSGKWNYSNQAYDLLAIIVERVSKMKFEKYLEANIFSIADMSSTSFSNKNIARPYRFDLNYGGLMDYGQYPSFFGKISGAAELKSTVGDLNKLFNTIKNTDKLLDIPHKSLLLSPLVKRGGSAFQSLGLKIDYETILNFGHSGVNVGNTSELKYFPDSDLLLIVLCNNRSGAPNLYNFVHNNMPR